VTEVQGTGPCDRGSFRFDIHAENIYASVSNKVLLTDSLRACSTYGVLNQPLFAGHHIAGAPAPAGSVEGILPYDDSTAVGVEFRRRL